MNIEKLKDIIQDCNINFLFGSGMSAPYLSTLNSIETLLTNVEDIEDENKKNIIRTSLYKKYFDEVIEKNLNILAEDNADAISLIDNYKRFFEIFNKIILERKSTLLSKQINIFTTNIDICLEKALEDKLYEYNDGFVGSFKPKFDLSNFKKSLFKSSLHFENISELPVFNIYKIHGSLTWENDESSILFSQDLKQISNIKNVVLSDDTLISIDSKELEDLKTSASTISYNEEEINNFKSKYEKLNIVNPTKDKFRDTILNQTYYELLRIYSNELEKDNSILFVLGFSFADEHIRDLTLRVANSNPTLIIYIVAYDKLANIDLESKFNDCKYNNIKILSPEKDEDGNDKFQYTFEAINKKIFKQLELKILEG